MTKQTSKSRQMKTSRSPAYDSELVSNRKSKKRLAKRTKRPKNIWGPEEDQKLLELIDVYGPSKWSTIAASMPGREGKQCRERWHNHLNPAILKEQWTESEDLRLFLLYKLYGSKWSVLSFMFNGRTDNSIKNHWNSIMKKKVRRFDAFVKSVIESQDYSGLEKLDIDLIERIKRAEFDNKNCRKGRTRNYRGFFEKNKLIEYVCMDDVDTEDRQAAEEEPANMRPRPKHISPVARSTILDLNFDCESPNQPHYPDNHLDNISTKFDNDPTSAFKHSLFHTFGNNQTSAGKSCFRDRKLNRREEDAQLVLDFNRNIESPARNRYYQTEVNNLRLQGLNCLVEKERFEMARTHSHYSFGIANNGQQSQPHQTFLSTLDGRSHDRLPQTAEKATNILVGSFVELTPNSCLSRKHKQSRLDTAVTLMNENEHFVGREDKQNFLVSNFIAGNENSAQRSPLHQFNSHSVYSEFGKEVCLTHFRNIETPTKAVFDFSNGKYCNSRSSVKDEHGFSNLKSLDITKSLEYGER